jgi:hypothetical protein
MFNFKSMSLKIGLLTVLILAVRSPFSMAQTSETESLSESKIEYPLLATFVGPKKVVEFFSSPLIQSQNIKTDSKLQVLQIAGCYVSSAELRDARKSVYQIQKIPNSNAQIEVGDSNSGRMELTLNFACPNKETLQYKMFVLLPTDNPYGHDESIDINVVIPLSGRK